MQYTIEEKVIERAYKKLALDALVIQQGRLAEQKSKHLFAEDLKVSLAKLMFFMFDRDNFMLPFLLLMQL